jgi:Holliday junction DNA helicase RuvA
MIAWLEGVLRSKQPTRVVLDVQGVGYELLISLSTFSQLPDLGKTVALHVRTIAREDALLLYGFATLRERAIFELLLRANRIGPKLAQTILSGIAPDHVIAALAGGDHKKLCTAPGVGKKMAERMVVELRDAAVELCEDAGVPALDGSGAGTSVAPAGDEIREQVLSALVNLGYPKSQADKVVEATAKELTPEEPIEAWIRVALRRLAR